MNLLILLVVIIVIAILVGLFYKYKLGGNKDEEDAIDRLCLETGWIRYEPGSKLLCHPDDKILITNHIRGRRQFNGSEMWAFQHIKHDFFEALNTLLQNLTENTIDIKIL